MSVSGVSRGVPLLTCRIEEELGVAVLHVSGELDMATAPILDAELRRLADRQPHVIVELSDLAYCDMSGVRLFETYHNLYHERGRLLVVVAPAGMVRRVFELVELTKTLAVTETREHAHALVRGSSPG